MSLDNHHSTNNHLDESHTPPNKPNDSLTPPEKTMDEDTFNSIRALHNTALHFDYQEDGSENDSQQDTAYYELLGSYFDALSLRSNSLIKNDMIQSSSSSCIGGRNGVVITAIVLMAIYPLIVSRRRSKLVVKQRRSTLLLDDDFEEVGILR